MSKKNACLMFVLGMSIFSSVFAEPKYSKEDLRLFMIYANGPSQFSVNYPVKPYDKPWVAGELDVHRYVVQNELIGDFAYNRERRDKFVSWWEEYRKIYADPSVKYTEEDVKTFFSIIDYFSVDYPVTPAEGRKNSFLPGSVPVENGFKVEQNDGKKSYFFKDKEQRDKFIVWWEKFRKIYKYMLLLEELFVIMKNSFNYNSH